MALSTLSSDVTESSRAAGHALIREDESLIALANSILGEGSGGAGGDASGSDEVEARDAGSAH